MTIESRSSMPEFHEESMKIGNKKSPIEKKLDIISNQIIGLENIEWDNPNSLHNKNAIKVLNQITDKPKDLDHINDKLENGLSEDIKILKTEIRQIVNSLKSEKASLENTIESEKNLKKPDQKQGTGTVSDNTKRSITTEVDQFINLFPDKDLDEKLSYSINKQFSYLASEEKTILKQIINETPENDRKDLFSLLSTCFLTEGLDSEKRTNILKAITESPQEKRKDAIGVASFMFLHGTESNNTMLIENLPNSIRNMHQGLVDRFGLGTRGVAALKKIIEESPGDKKYTTLFIDLLSKETTTENKDQLLESIAKTPQTDRDVFIQEFLLFKKRGGESFHSFISLNQDERTNLNNDVKLFMLCFSERSDFSEKEKIIEFVENLPREEREEIIEVSHSFFTDTMNFNEKQEIIWLISSLPQGKREESITLIRSPSTDNIDFSEKKEVINLIGRLPESEREEITELAQSFFTDNTTLKEKKSWITLVGNLPKTERKEILELARPLIGHLKSSFEINEITQLIKNFPPGERAKIIELAQLFFTESTTFSQKKEALQLVGRLPQEQRKEIVTSAQLFFTDTMTFSEKKEAVKLIESFPLEERKEIITLVQSFKSSLFTEKMSWEDKAIILKEIQKITPADREVVVNLAPSFFTKQMSSYERTWTLREIQRIIQEISTTDRKEIVRLAPSFFTKGIDVSNNLEMLTFLNTVTTNAVFTSLHQLFSDFDFITTTPVETTRLLVKQFGLHAITATLEDKDNKDAIFQLLCELSSKDEKQIMESMINKFGTANIANNFSKMTNFFPPHLRIDLSILLLNKEYSTVLQHLEEYPIDCLPTAALGSSSILQESTRLQTDLSKLQIQDKAEMVFGDHSGISINQLLTSFDTINFTSPDQPGYVSPNACSDDGENKPPSHFKEGLGILINQRIGRPEEAYIGAPSDKNERAAWYARLEQILKEVVRLSNEKSSDEPTLVATEIVRLGAAGHHCGGRWLRDSIAAVNALSDRWEVDIQSQGVPGIVASWINNYKEGILESLTLELTPSYGGRTHQPHIFNAMAKCLIAYGIEPPNADLIDINDSLMPELTDSDMEKIKQKFDEYFGVKNLSKFIADKINEEIQLNRGPFIDLVVSTMRDIAESRIQDQMKVLDAGLVGEKRKYGEAKAKQILEEEQIKLAIINDDKETLSTKNKMAVLKIKSQFNSELSNQVEEQMEKDGLEESDQPRVEKELRDNAKKTIEQNIQKYTQLLSPTGNIEELEALGTERATNELKAKKNTLCDEYLTKENLLTYEKVEIYDNEMMMPVKFDRPRLSFLGAMTLLSTSNFLKMTAPAAFEQEGNLSAVPGVGRRSLEENIKQLNDEFVNGLYIRTFSDPQFEYDEVICQKIASEQDSSKSDSKYWSSTSTVQAGLRNKLWRGESSDRCGLVLSSQASLGGWNSRDMGTENVPASLTNDDEIKNFFPNHFPPIDLSAILNAINKNDDAARELVKKILDLPTQSVSDDDFKRVESFLSERADPHHKEHNDLLLRIPDKYKSIFNLEQVQQKMREMAKERRTQEYNEAKIHYGSNDILGVFVFNDPGSLAKGAELQKQLATSGIVVPLVTFEENKGSVRVYNQAKEVPPHLP